MPILATKTVVLVPLSVAFCVIVYALFCLIMPLLGLISIILRIFQRDKNIKN